MLGIGLGGFVDGFKDGYGLRLSMQEEREKQDLKEKIGAIDTDAKAAFDAEVKAGTVDKKDFDTFWMDYALPKMAHERLLAGDIGGAKSLMDWGESRDAKEGARQFGQSLVKLFAGDYDGAIDSALGAAENKGYINHGLDLGGYDKLVNKNGDVLGYRFTFKDENGEPQTKDVPLNELGTFISGLANPEAAFQSQQAGLKGNGGSEDKARKAAIAALRKRMPPADEIDTTPGFDDLSRDEQEKLIAREVRLQEGAPEPAAKAPAQVIVDQGTGKKVDPQNVSGLGTPTAPTAPVPAPARSGASRAGAAVGKAAGQLPAAPTPTPTAPQAEPVGLGGTPVTETRPQNGPDPASQRAQILQEATMMLQNGGNPQVIAQRLQKAGLPPADIEGLVGQAGR